MSFYNLYTSVIESREDFYVGDILVHLIEISDNSFNEAVRPPNVQSLKEPEVDPDKMKKWRATYVINGKTITNYLTALGKNEAKQMLYEFLTDPNKKEIVKTAEFAPVNNWNELIRLLQYSMTHDKNNTFDSLDVADFHLMLLLVKKHPNFIKKQLDGLDPKLQFYFKKAYNGLTKRDLNKDLENPWSGSYWSGKIKGLMAQHGKSIKQRVVPLKTRNTSKPENNVEPDILPIEVKPEAPRLPPRSYHPDKTRLGVYEPELYDMSRGIF